MEVTLVDIGEVDVDVRFVPQRFVIRLFAIFVS